MTDPKTITIKVTDGDHHAYFVHFDRDDHTLLAVFEYKQIYTPRMGKMSTRNKLVTDLAKSRISEALETQGDIQ